MPNDDTLPSGHRRVTLISVSPYAGDAQEWDAFVRQQPGWTHFHLSGWYSVIRDVFRHQCLYLTARGADGRLAGVLPLVRVKSVVFGHYLVSMPFVNYGGPLGSGEAISALVRHASALATRDGVRLLELRSRQPLDIDLPVSHRRITALLDLPAGDPQLLWRRLDAKLRSQIRKPQKEGVMVRFGVQEVQPFYEVFSRHMRDLGSPAQSRSFFEAIAATFGDDVWFGCAYYDERPVACGCGFRWGNEFEITWASSLLASKRLAPNMQLYWAFLERAVREGVRVFNFGRCMPGSGTHKFKQQWGTRDESLWWYGLAARPGTGTPAPSDPAYAWGPRVWRHLPTVMTSMLGPRIVRYIP